jgi:hypothetical protein
LPGQAEWPEQRDKRGTQREHEAEDLGLREAEDLGLRQADRRGQFAPARGVDLGRQPG